MKVCSKCGHENQEGFFYCEKCNTPLITEATPLTTATIPARPSTHDITRPEDNVIIPLPVGANLVLDIGGTILAFPDASKIDIGRQPDANVTGVWLDTTAYGGYAKGVSRRHAQIRMTADRYLELVDLGSANGTFLNGFRLPSLQPYFLNDRDEVFLGQLIIFVHHQKPERE